MMAPSPEAQIQRKTKKETHACMSMHIHTFCCTNIHLITFTTHCLQTEKNICFQASLHLCLGFPLMFNCSCYPHEAHMIKHYRETTTQCYGEKGHTHTHPHTQILKACQEMAVDFSHIYINVYILTFFSFFLPPSIFCFIFCFPISQLRRCSSLIFAPCTHDKDSHMYICICSYSQSTTCIHNLVMLLILKLLQFQLFINTHTCGSIMLFRKKQQNFHNHLQIIPKYQFFWLVVHKCVWFQSKKLVVHKFVCGFKQTHKKVILAVIRWCLGV